MSTTSPDLPPATGGNPADRPNPPKKMTLSGRLRAYFLAGILVTAPISITFYLASEIIAIAELASTVIRLV